MSEGYDWDSYKWCNGSYNTLTKYNNNSQYGTVDNLAVLESADDAAHMTLGGKWRMPTVEDYDELLSNCTTNWIEQDGVMGRKFTSRINSKSIFLPAAGYRFMKSIYYVGSYGYYWSSTVDLSTYGNITSGRRLFFWQNSINTYEDSRIFGCTIRPVYK